MPASVDISICVPVYKVHDEPNVTTLAETVPPALGGLKGELIVAVNGVPADRAGVPTSARAVQLGVNRGVSVGWNQAAALARGQILCFSNDDVLLGPNSRLLLVDVLRTRADAGVVGPIGANWDVARGERERVSGDDLPTGSLRVCDVLSGFLFAVRREVFMDVGGFDEAYAPASFEEIDFCYAVRRLGLRCYVVGGVEVAHEWGISSRQPPWRRIAWDGRRELLWSIHRRNRRRLAQKWGGR